MNKFDTITADKLQKKLTSIKSPVLINTLDEEAYRAKRIPGSINIPTDHIDRIKQVVSDKGQPIVVYCANTDCDASPKAANALIGLGYKQINDFEEGLEGWEKAGYPLVGQQVS